MEPLGVIPKYLEPQYLSLIKRHGLHHDRFTADSQYKEAYCDEDPLYTRYTEIDFLKDYPCEYRNRILLSMAIELWVKTEESLINRRIPYIHFISLWEWEQEEGEYPCPYFFFCGDNTMQIRKLLSLSSPMSNWSRKLKEDLCLDIGAEKVRVFEDIKTQPGMVRLLIDFNQPWLNSNKIGLSSKFKIRNR